MLRLLQSLKFQIAFAITLLTALFAGATLYSLHIIDQQHNDDVLVHLASQLQFNQQHLTVQAMRYQENAPRDYDTYYRDVRLYFEDLKKTRASMSMLIDSFASNRFDPALTGEPASMQARLPSSSHDRAIELAAQWQAFLARLDELIGPDPAEPRLEWAAEWIVENNSQLEEASEHLLNTLRHDVAIRAERANVVNRILLAAALIVAISTALWFYRRVLTPLGAAVAGFNKVASGDFSHRVPVMHDNELGWMASSFNQLSNRLEALRALLTGLEQGGDLEGTLGMLSTSLPALIPVDWVGVLVVGVEGRIHLEKAFSDGEPEPTAKLSFTAEHTVLEECIRNRKPLHIPDVGGTAGMSQHYVFMRHLAELGRRDAVFLPIENGAVQGVAVFASRYPNNFRSEHLELIGNLAVLLGVSLGRTIQLTESVRLASIGQFASGIAHEIRNPLATISLALDHLETNGKLDSGSAKRVRLASTETARLERLLEDILLYAKPLVLNRQHENVNELLDEVIASERAPQDQFDVDTASCPPIVTDRDRLRQVLINLIRNARQASPRDTPIQVRCRSNDNWVEIDIVNQGTPIPADMAERIFEPFVTTKAQGTGLGLPIVRRIVEAHGGEVAMTSNASSGTRVTLSLPIAERQPAVDDVSTNAD